MLTLVTERPEHGGYAGDLPGSKRSPCLGCDTPVIASRHAHVSFGGTRDGTALIVFEVFPQLSLTTEDERLLRARTLYLLGLAHRECAGLARERLQREEVNLPDELPLLKIEEIDNPDEMPPPLHEPPTGERCPFCGSSDRVTEEHVWPKWVSRALRQVSEEPFRITAGGRARSAQVFNITAPVCHECNTRWLSTLENDVRPILAPMIVGESRKLWAEDQEKLAAWAAKTALMIDLSQKGKSMIPEGYFRELRLRRTALPSQVVYISAYGGSTWAGWAHGLGLRADGAAESASPAGFVITFTVFRVVFQVMGHFASGEVRLNEGRWQYAAAIERIWPRWKLPVEWPKSTSVFFDKSLEEFANSVNLTPPSGD